MSKTTKTPLWTYGDPAPKTHRDLADVLRQRTSNKTKKKSSGLLDRLDKLEQLLKDH